MKKSISIILTILTLFLLVGCSNSGSGDAAVETKKEKMADEAESEFEVSSAFNNQFVVSGVAGINEMNAHLMYNNDNDSYKFALRYQGHDKPSVTFYLAKAEVPDTDRYVYAYVVLSASNYIFQQIKDEQTIMLIGNGFDSHITMNDIENNFNMTESDEFTLKSESDL